MNEDLRDAARRVAESTKDLAAKLEALARIALGMAGERARDFAAEAEPLVDEAAAKVRDLAGRVEAAIDRAAGSEPKVG